MAKEHLIKQQSLIFKAMPLEEMFLGDWCKRSAGGVMKTVGSSVLASSPQRSNVEIRGEFTTLSAVLKRVSGCRKRWEG